MKHLIDTVWLWTRTLKTLLNEAFQYCVRIQLFDCSWHQNICEWNYGETCLNQTLSKPKTCLNQTLSKPKTCLNQTLSKPKTCLNHTLSKPKTCLNQTLSKKKTCLNQTLSKPKTCLNQTLSKPKTCLNRTLSKPKTCLNQTDFIVPSTKCLCNLNPYKPNPCLNWTNSSVQRGFGLSRFYCISECTEICYFRRKKDRLWKVFF